MRPFDEMKNRSKKRNRLLRRLLKWRLPRHYRVTFFEKQKSTFSSSLRSDQNNCWNCVITLRMQ